MKNRYWFKVFIFVLFVVFFAGLFSTAGCRSENIVREVKQITAKEVYDIITEKKDYTILDVRSQAEYDSGHLENAVLIPVDDLEARIDEVPDGKPVIVYCRSGNRSARAAAILLKNDFFPVYDMQGGITRWIDDGYPID
jgi:phage shock protein E